MADEEPGINTGVLLFIPYREMERRVFAELASRGYDDITLSQGRVFQRVAEGGSRLTDLAEQARITKQSAGFLIDRLEEAGYVERVPDPTDARARLVRAAPRGRRVIAEAAEIVAGIEAEWAAHLGDRDMADLRRILLRLREITDPYA
ncbi:MarR family winged helix-turn-helix transcriptional regulator [Nocardiopsis sp. CC223A]|uniref:MarR family winged helix-turn-helix transcriptional regulator n=1 Tax=Nocardiopsis sp. CC223A TaxID=3044051 RepID=UPI002795E991|nr:MarR family transcriptional regulator [Nocardiopsis sp. CC223A]